MSISELLNALSTNPDSLSLGEKVMGGLAVAALSMAVVFVVLIIIAFIIQIINPQPKPVNEPVVNDIKISSAESEEAVEVNLVDNKQLVAVITAAISATSSNNIVVRRIVRTNNSQSAWEKVK